MRLGDGVVDIELDKDDDQPKQDIQYHAYSRAMHQQVINTLLKLNIILIYFSIELNRCAEKTARYRRRILIGLTLVLFH
jgi:hypothetical protein